MKDEVIGGTYLRQTVQGTDKDSFVSATVGSTNLILKAGTFKSNVIAGGKSNDYTGSLSSDVLGDTSLTITGGTYEAAVLGGGSAKAGRIHQARRLRRRQGHGPRERHGRHAQRRRGRRSELLVHQRRTYRRRCDDPR